MGFCLLTQAGQLPWALITISSRQSFWKIVISKALLFICLLFIVLGKRCWLVINSKQTEIPSWTIHMSHPESPWCFKIHLLNLKMLCATKAINDEDGRKQKSSKTVERNYKNKLQSHLEQGATCVVIRVTPFWCLQLRNAIPLACSVGVLQIYTAVVRNI